MFGFVYRVQSVNSVWFCLPRAKCVQSVRFACLLSQFLKSCLFLKRQWDFGEAIRQVKIGFVSASLREVKPRLFSETLEVLDAEGCGVWIEHEGGLEADGLIFVSLVGALQAGFAEVVKDTLLEGGATVDLGVESVGSEENERIHAFGVGLIFGDGVVGISAGEEFLEDERIEELFSELGESAVWEAEEVVFEDGVVARLESGAESSRKTFFHEAEFGVFVHVVEVVGGWSVAMILLFE